MSIDAPNQDTPRLVSVPGKSFKSVAVGEYHMAAITVDGEVYAFGKNNRGQLGVAAEAGTPVLVDSLAGVKAVAVACGRQHSLVLDDSGAVFGFGDNTLGAVGSGAKAIVRTPVRIEFPTPEKVVEIACGRDHSLFLTAGGSVFATGADSDGQLGDGFADLKQFAPIRIKAFDGIKIEKIIAGKHAGALELCTLFRLWG